MTALRAQLRASTRYPALARRVSLAATVVAASADVLELAASRDTIREEMAKLTEAVQRLNQHFTALNNTLRETGESP